MEVLTQFFLKAQADGELHGFKMGRRSNGIPILQFADDTMVMVDGTLKEASLVRDLLFLFEAFSGLKVNTNKSVLFEVNKVSHWDEILKLWDCRSGAFLDSYLGMPLGAKSRSISIWEPLVERFRRRLAVWKRTYLSKGGRLVLLKSTLSSLSVYMMSLYLMPMTVALELEKIMKRFLWGTRDGDKKFHLVAWDVVCLPFEEGGLGLKRIREFNIALMCKWFWRLGDNKLWVRLLREKYGVDGGGFFPKFPKGTIGCSVWSIKLHFTCLYTENYFSAVIKLRIEIY